ncbi:MAG: cytochrome B subunit [Bradymonadales bacterium]|nr:MAG: cytochrome B subunit [Bradymonadales bacterium]
MSQIGSFLMSNIGLKILMAVSGILMSLFLLAHVAGNLIILVSPEAFNEYAHLLTSNKALLYSAEAGLVAVVALHIFSAIVLSRRNRAARPQAYAYKKNTGLSRRSWASSNMIWTGSFIVIFLVFHILHFKFGDYVETEQDGVVMRDLADTVVAGFSNPWTVAFYVFALILILMHLRHGVRSAFASLGLESLRWAPAIQKTSDLFVFAVMGAFILIPLWILILGV